MRRWHWCLVAASVLYPVNAQAQGVLQRGRELPPAAAAPAASPPAPSTTKSQTDTSGSNGANGLDPDAGTALFVLGLAAAGAVVVGPFLLPATLLGDQGSNDGYFPIYPYADHFPGYQRINPFYGAASVKNGTNFDEPDYLRPWSVRFAAEEGTDFRGVNRVNGRLFLDTLTRLGVLTNWNYLDERLGHGRADHTTLGDTNVTLRIGQSEKVQVYTGLGWRVRTDDVNTRWGFNFLYGIDWYPVEPVIVSTSLDVGSIGSQWVFHGRGTVGVTYRHFELFGGYDFMRLGAVNIQGPLVGVRIWF